MGYFVRDAENARYNGRNDWKKVGKQLFMGQRVGGFITTCQDCGKEYEARYGNRTINCMNATQYTPYHPEYDYLCFDCVDKANENKNYEIPDSRGWEDRIVHWVPTNAYHGSDAYGVVLKEDEPDCRGNVLVYIIAPYETAIDRPHECRILTMPYEALTLVEPEDEPENCVEIGF